MKRFALVVLLAFLVALAYGLSDEQKEKVKSVHRDCQADPATHADEDKLKEAYKGDDISGLGVHFLCMSKGLGLQKANGDVDKPAIKSKLSEVISDPTKLQEAVDKCATQKTTPEDTAEHVLKCFHDYAGHVLHVHGHHH